MIKEWDEKKDEKWEWEGHRRGQNYSCFTISYLQIHSPAETSEDYTEGMVTWKKLFMFNIVVGDTIDVNRLRNPDEDVT